MGTNPVSANNSSIKGRNLGQKSFNKIALPSPISCSVAVVYWPFLVFISANDTNKPILVKDTKET